MKFVDNLICPVSGIRIDNNASRLTVFLNTLLIGAFLFTKSPWFMVVVGVDYGIRAFWEVEYSPLRWLAIQVAKRIGLPHKSVDQAPKLFASRIGFLCAASSALLAFAFPTAGVVVASVLIVFTTLDSVANFCVGCLTYTYLVLPFYRKRYG